MPLLLRIAHAFLLAATIAVSALPSRAVIVANTQIAVGSGWRLDIYKDLNVFPSAVSITTGGALPQK